jgi:hypothetical protein
MARSMNAKALFCPPSMSKGRDGEIPSARAAGTSHYFSGINIFSSNSVTRGVEIVTEERPATAVDRILKSAKGFQPHGVSLRRPVHAGTL